MCLAQCSVAIGFIHFVILTEMLRWAYRLFLPDGTGSIGRAADTSQPSWTDEANVGTKFFDLGAFYLKNC